MLLSTESAVHSRKYLLWRHAVRTERSEVRAAWRHNKYFPYRPNSRLIRALLYTHTSKTTKSQCFPLLLWTEVQPVHTPVRTQAYGPALSRSNFSILSVFCLVYNKLPYPPPFPWPIFVCLMKQAYERDCKCLAFLKSNFHWSLTIRKRWFSHLPPLVNDLK